jgi:hypothetical protein
MPNRNSFLKRPKAIRLELLEPRRLLSAAYQFTDIGAQFSVVGINDSGQVALSGQPGPRNTAASVNPYLYSNGTIALTAYFYPPGMIVGYFPEVPVAVNGAGQVLGYGEYSQYGGIGSTQSYRWYV